MLLTSIVLATLSGGLLSAMVAGLLVAGFPQRWLPRLVGFATGVLMSVALLDILPEAFESGIAPHKLFAALLVSLIGFYALERAALWRHSHGGEEHDHHGHDHHHDMSSIVPAVVLGDSFHNFVDGVMLAATFLTSPTLGWSTAIAVIAHEIPQEAGDFVLLRTAGVAIRRAFMLNGFSSLCSLIGGVIGYLALQHARPYLPYALILAASSLLYIAISDLLPLLRREAGARNLAWQGGTILSGIALIALVTATLR
ncbi:MAG TPA: ZIP family metal transporter [Rhodocyclaceae bacterium]|nr:ZIP family metal transporter [Rhodocyclaceae bacterium]